MVTRGRQLDSRYARILGIGLGISVVVHGVVLGLGRLSDHGPADVASQLSLVEFVERDVTPEDTEIRPVEAEESAPASAAWGPAANFRPATEDIPVAALDLSESRRVLAAATSKHLSAPLVPRPRVIPARENVGMTPIHVREPLRLATRERGRSGSGGGTGIDGISIFVIGAGGGGVCLPVPGAVPLRRPIPPARLGTSPTRIGVRSRF